MEATTGAASASPIAPAIQNAQVDRKSANVSAPVSAGAIAPQFGGLRAGRKRADGLIPGSPEAREADKKKDRERKQKEREEQKRLAPAPLPSLAPGLAGQAKAIETGSPAVGQLPGDQTLAPGFVPWEPEALRPIFAQLIPAAEELSVKQITDRAEKARLPGDLVREIEKDAAWSTMAKKGLELSAPQVTAKWLNRFGISAENQAELVLGTSLASILAGHTLLLRRLDKLIAMQTRPADSSPPAPASSRPGNV